MRYLKQWSLKRTEISKIELFSVYIKQQQGYTSDKHDTNTHVLQLEVTGEQTGFLILGGLCGIVWANESFFAFTQLWLSVNLGVAIKC